MGTGYIAGCPHKTAQRFCRYSLSKLPTSLQGNGIEVSDIPVSLILQRFTDDVSCLPDAPVDLSSTLARSIERLCLQVLSCILYGLEIR